MTVKPTLAGIFPSSGWKMIAGLSLLLLSTASSAGMQDNMVMRGTLVAEPCVIAPGGEAVRLEFEIVSDKYIYTNQRTLGKSFEVFLTDCEVTTAKSVRITIKGTENPLLPGLLAINAASKAAGFAIGIETPEGKPVPINKLGEIRGLSTGKNTIPLKAYIQGEPQAIANRSIKFGTFSATATFTLEYE